LLKGIDLPGGQMQRFSCNENIEKVRRLLSEALAGIESYLNNWPQLPQDFTNEAELHFFMAKLLEMQKSLDIGTVIAIPGLWRIMETWHTKMNCVRRLLRLNMNMNGMQNE
jgi:hypothetical protein